jgi:hypothetical protein
VNSLELDSVIVQARLGSARLLYKLGSTRLGYCTSSARARLSSTRLGSFTGLVAVGSKKKGKKHRRTSVVWQFFDIVPNVDSEDSEVWAKCKLCHNKYKAQSSFGTRNLRKHVQACPGSNNRDVGQMLLAGKLGSLSVSDSKFDPKIYRELVVISIIKHDLLFPYVEYEGIRDTHQYLLGDVPFISRNTVNADLVKMYLREKERVKSMLSVCPERICLTSDLWMSLTTDGKYMPYCTFY